jgi:hypothetical protein
MTCSKSPIFLGSWHFCLAVAGAAICASAMNCSPAASGRPGAASRGGSSGSVVITTKGGSSGLTGIGGGTGIDLTGNNTALCEKFGGIACQVKDCGDKPKTTVKGKVYDPAGKNPLYNVAVYVPTTSLSPIADGASCDTCSSNISGQPIAAAITSAQGEFTMDNVPVGTNIPVVIQIGKWQRQTTIPEVKACQDNVLTDPNLFRLPRNQSEGHIPKIALVAGDADRLQCLLYRMGLESSVFTNPEGTGAVNIYNLPSDLGPDQGGAYDSTVNNGARYPDGRVFWNDLASMMKYDMILLACGGVQKATDPTKYAPYDSDPSPISDAAKANMVSYVNAGGRAFGEHYHWAWIKGFPSPKPSDATKPPYPPPFGTEVATWIPYTETDGVPATGTIEQSFPRGQSFAEWLVAVGASTTLGILPLNSDVKPTAQDQINPPGQRWIYEPNGAGPAALRIHYLSFNTPIGTPEETQCGRFVYTGLHVTGGPDDPNKDIKSTFPSTCKVRDLVTAEKALEFMIFDLSSCVTPPKADPTQIILI